MSTTHAQAGTSLNRSAVQATVHCLTGCAIGEVLGMVIATALGWDNIQSIVVSIALAFLFGYALTIQSVLRAGIGFRRALGVAFASDTVSITSMEIVDNVFIAFVPGALDAGLADALFWWSLALSLVIAFVLTVPVNRWLIARGRGHAVVHEHHAPGDPKSPRVLLRSHACLRESAVSRRALDIARGNPEKTRGYNRCLEQRGVAQLVEHRSPKPGVLHG